MKLSSLPARIAAIFAASAPPSAINTIPLTAAGTTQPGQASFDVGFPAVTMQPSAAGGINPYGQDFNGIVNAITAVQQWQSAGGSFPFDASFASDIGGYPAGAVLMRADGMGFWLCLTDNNTTNPDSTGAANWAPLDAYGISPITGLTTGTVTLTPAQYGLPIITLTGTLTGNVQLVFPATKNQWQVINNTAGNFSVTAKTAAGSGVIVQQGGAANVYGDGVNILLPQALQVGAATQSQHAVQFGQMQASMLGASAVTLVPTATALTSENAGQLLVFSSGVVGTLPAASSIKSGQGLKFFSIVAGASVARAGTTDTITVGSTNVTSIALNAGDTLTLISNGSNGWYAVDGSAKLGSSAVFGSSIGSSGYQKLPSGLILQWGSANTGASPTAVTFPIAFPNACRSVTLGANYSTSPAGAQITSGPSTTGFSLQLTTFTGTNLPGQNVSWMAIGN